MILCADSKIENFSVEGLAKSEATATFNYGRLCQVHTLSVSARDLEFFQQTHFVE